MTNILTTGGAAKALGTTEPRLNDLIRRGRIDSPPMSGGRRLWTRTHLEQAAKAVGLNVVAKTLAGGTR